MVSVSVPDSLFFLFLFFGMTVMWTLRFLVRLWFKSFSGSLLIILYYNRTRNWSVNITVMPKKKKIIIINKKKHGVWNTDAKHYLDVFRLMSNLQVTCVDVCQRLRNMPTTYGQRMRNVWVIRWHTSQNFKYVKICRRARRTRTYADVCQRASACS